MSNVKFLRDPRITKLTLNELKNKYPQAYTDFCEVVGAGGIEDVDVDIIGTSPFENEKPNGDIDRRDPKAMEDLRKEFREWVEKWMSWYINKYVMFFVGPASAFSKATSSNDELVVFELNYDSHQLMKKAYWASMNDPRTPSHHFMPWWELDDENAPFGIEPIDRRKQTLSIGGKSISANDETLFSNVDLISLFGDALDAVETYDDKSVKFKKGMLQNFLIPKNALKKFGVKLLPLTSYKYAMLTPNLYAFIGEKPVALYNDKKQNWFATNGTITKSSNEPYVPPVSDVVEKLLRKYVSLLVETRKGK